MMSSAMQGAEISSEAIFSGIGSSYNGVDLMSTETMVSLYFLYSNIERSTNR